MYIVTVGIVQFVLPSTPITVKRHVYCPLGAFAHRCSFCMANFLTRYIHLDIPHPSVHRILPLPPVEIYRRVSWAELALVLSVCFVHVLGYKRCELKRKPLASSSLYATRRDMTVLCKPYLELLQPLGHDVCTHTRVVYDEATMFCVRTNGTCPVSLVVALVDVLGCKP